MGRCSFALAINKEDFCHILKRYLEDPNVDAKQRKQVIFDFAYKQDGKASQRIADVIEEILQNK